MREAALLILFQLRLNSSTLEEILQDNEESFELAYNKSSLDLVNGVTEHSSELEDIISGYSPSRKPERISYINMTIMKLAVYEMKYCPSVPKKVAINEAVEFAKDYCSPSDVKFINGVLNSFYKENGDA